MRTSFIPLVFVLLVAPTVHAGVIGANVPSQPVTAGRIAELPAKERAAWFGYLQRSEAQRHADRAEFDSEVKIAGKPPVPGKLGHAAASMPLSKDAAWYGKDEALKIASTILSFQLPSGGWSKNLDMRQSPRAVGQSYTTDNDNRFPSPGDFDATRDVNWHYVGTLDNDATSTQLKFLRRVIAAFPVEKSAEYRASYLRGIQYLLNAQFPNGGWPQVWPLEGGYHDNITFNDGAVMKAMEVLEPVANGEVAFVPLVTQRKAKQAIALGVSLILRTQIVVNDKKTVWCQQHDPLTLKPASARNYEMPSLASGESDDVLLFLMSLPHPSPAVKAAIEAGVTWFQATEIMGYTWGGTRAEGRHLAKVEGDGPIWARYYSLTTNTPIFGDRDKTIHDDVSELSLERRNGYAWYNDEGVAVLKRYAEWEKKNGAK